MSGLAGILHFHGRLANPGTLRRMQGTMEHRGPDGAGVWCEQGVGFAHSMLHTTPHSLLEQLPLVSRCNKLVITADARIDNRDELISNLYGPMPRSELICDAEIILTAYKQWGERCPERLLGDFAFAIWDKREQRVFCARDHAGIKPFFYARLPTAFVFSSEIKAVLAHPLVPRQLNESKVADFLALTYFDQEITFYEHVFRLPPAHTMTVSRSEYKKRRYWQLDSTWELQLRSDEEYEECFRELFTDAVGCRLRSAFAVGCSLSGGLDSSAIACTAEKLISSGKASLRNGSALRTYSGIFPSVADEDPSTNERPYVEAVLESGNFLPHYVDAGGCRLFEEISYDPDECSSLPNIYLYSLLMKAARRDNVRVMLSGFEGDVTVSYGYELLGALAQSGDWSRFALEASALAARPFWPATAYLNAYGLPELAECARRFHWISYVKGIRYVRTNFPVSARRILAETSAKAMMPGLVGRIRRKGRRPVATEHWRRENPAINDEFARTVGLEHRYVEETVNGLTGRAKYRQGHINSLTGNFLQAICEEQNQIAALNGIEQRYPFFDRRLMEFCVAIPFDQKLKDGWPRSILRRAMREIVPCTILERVVKGTMGLNTHRLMAQEFGRFERLMGNPDAVEHSSKYLDLSTLRTSFERLASNPKRCRREDLMTCFLGLSLMSWLKDSGPMIA